MAKKQETSMVNLNTLLVKSNSDVVSKGDITMAENHSTPFIQEGEIVIAKFNGEGPSKSWKRCILYVLADIKEDGFFYKLNTETNEVFHPMTIINPSKISKYKKIVASSDRKLYENVPSISQRDLQIYCNLFNENINRKSIEITVNVPRSALSTKDFSKAFPIEEFFLIDTNDISKEKQESQKETIKEEIMKAISLIAYREGYRRARNNFFKDFTLFVSRISKEEEEKEIQTSHDKFFKDSIATKG